ncbi:MAG: AAA family ATPase [Lachnospiraceae bacterium]|nr:AAA family ATPase [Lachnospiraceae bacterium]
MNIKQAKEDIKNAVSAYLTKDQFGNYVIPVERQRPVFLMGAPGIGKTAIMEQIAQELQIGLISYSMTHHTRQSALGLPFIVRKNYGGEEYSVSEYTMSEIIASIYDLMEGTGLKEGILFLDEINCVSETLAPSMLQFLQYKTFGRHSVPGGWIVVTAGNPPEYNNSVREFDIVTWDRLKRIDVEADYEVWKEYAYARGIHPAVTTYLDIKKDDFYRIETTVDGKSFVTARGWSDLSDMVKLYEQKEIAVTEQLVVQYLQNKKIAKNFAVYYDLFRKYRSDYQVDKILAGKAGKEITARAKAAKFDERLSLLGLLIDALVGALREVTAQEGAVMELVNCLRLMRADFVVENNFLEVVSRQIEAEKNTVTVGKKAGNLSADREYILNLTIAALGEQLELTAQKAPASGDAAFKLLKSDFDKRKKALTKLVTRTDSDLTNTFRFCEAAFEAGSQELLILVTELTVNSYAAHYIGKYGCQEYFKHNKDMLFTERKKDILAEIDELMR